MRKIAYLLTFAVLCLGLGSKEASAKTKVNGYLYRTPGLCATTNPTFDVSEFDRLSVVTTYSSGTYANVTFTDGTKSSVNVTVANNTYVFNSTPTLAINGVNVVYTPGATATLSCKAIQDSINANASLNTIVISTCPSGGSIVYSTSTLPGLNAYSITSSSWAALTPSNFIYGGGIDGDVGTTTDIITKANTFPLAQGVFITTTTNVMLGGLTWGTTYFVIPVQYGTSFKLATTAANALLGTAIDISTSTAGGGAFTASASTYTAGSAGYQWQASNDNSNFFTIPAISSVTVPGSGTTSVGWDFGNYNYRFLRLNFTAPTRGCVVIDAAITGKDFN